MDLTTAGAGGRLAHLLPLGNTGVNYLLWSSKHWELVDAGVDWLTCSSPDLEVAQRLRLRALGLFVQLEHEGDRRRCLKWEGYEGEQVGSLFYGERHDGVCCWASGATAGRLFDSVRDLDLRATRLDLQATLKTDADVAGLARSMADAADPRRVAGRREGRPLTVQLVESYGRGDTVYIGSPKSYLRGRSYDKHKESGGVYAPGSWRWEFQARSSQARQLFASIRSVSEVPRAAVGHVGRYWGDRGVPLPLEGVELGAALQSSKRVKDIDRALEWLRSTVRPSVDGWSQAGFREQVLEALGVTG